MSARVAASLLVLALASCQASPPEVVAPRALPPPAIAEAPRESFVARETRLVPAEVLIHSYTQIFGDLMLPEVRAPYDDTVLVMPGMTNLKAGMTTVRLGRYED